MGAVIVQLAAVAALFALSACADQDDTHRRYTLSNDPEDEILSIGWSCGSYPTRRFTLYGDGRLVGRLRGCRHTSPDFEVPVELRLSAELVKTIVDNVVDAGLIEYKSGDLRRKLGPPIFVATDTGGIFLRVLLSSYDSPRRREPLPFAHSVVIGSPSVEMGRYREAKAAGRLSESDPDTFVEAEALLHVYQHLDQLVYGPQRNTSGGGPVEPNDDRKPN